MKPIEALRCVWWIPTRGFRRSIDPDANPDIASESEVQNGGFCQSRHESRHRVRIGKSKKRFSPIQTRKLKWCPNCMFAELRFICASFLSRLRSICDSLFSHLRSIRARLLPVLRSTNRLGRIAWVKFFIRRCARFAPDVSSFNARSTVVIFVSGTGKRT